MKKTKMKYIKRMLSRARRRRGKDALARRHSRKGAYRWESEANWRGS